MLREILTTGFIDKNINLDRKKVMSPGKTKEKKISKNPSIKSFKTSSKNSNNNKPIMEKKIDIIKNRPDFLVGLNNESTMQTTSINKQYIYSNEITKNLMTPIENENLNFNGNINNNNNTNNTNNEKIPIELNGNTNNKNTNINTNIIPNNKEENNKHSEQ